MSLLYLNASNFYDYILSFISDSYHRCVLNLLHSTIITFEAKVQIRNELRNFPIHTHRPLNKNLMPIFVMST